MSNYTELLHNVCYLRKKEIYPRLSIETLEKDDYAYSLFIQGYSRMLTEIDIHSPTSFFQIAGIHRLPREPYPGETIDSTCRHGSTTFPTWHRAYVLLIEQCLIYHAEKFFDTVEEGDFKRKLKKRLVALRFPYFEWDLKDLKTPPSIFAEMVTTFDFTGNRVTLPNPVYSYTFQSSLNYSNIPCIEGTQTLRYPIQGRNISNTRKLKEALKSNIDILSRKDQMLTNQDYEEFSNHKVRSKISLESVHDAMHLKIGGIQNPPLYSGHMCKPSCAAFDPIFFLHHCNVDRLFALWQSLHINSWFKSNQESSDNLAPFHSNEPGYPYVNSNDLRHWEEWGYSYPGITPNNLNTLTKFFPLSSLRLKRKYFWSLQFDSFKRRSFGGSFEIRVFFDLPHAKPKTSRLDPHFVGSIGIFALDQSEECETCNQSDTQSASISLNHILKKFNYDIEDLSIKDEIERKIKVLFIATVDVNIHYQVDVYDSISNIIEKNEENSKTMMLEKTNEEPLSLQKSLQQTVEQSLKDFNEQFK